MNTLPIVLRGASKIGWYEGSGFLLIMSTCPVVYYLENAKVNNNLARYSQLQVGSYWHLRYL